MKIIGHEKEKEIFGRVLKENRLHHAYILSGREGTGKKLFAKALAKAVLCENGAFLTDCKCRQCVLADSGAHPDIHIIEESPLKIDKAREISADAFMTPLTARKKAYVIDSADTFGQEAANALLKTLEEPPADTYFFLITSRYPQVLHTIRSRCISIGFGLLSDDEVCEVVSSNSDKTDDEIKAAVAISSGSAGYALYMLENMEKQPTFGKTLNPVELFFEIESLDDKEKVRAYCASLYGYLLEKYKRTGNETLLDFSNYLLDILKRLEYNVSLDIFRLDLYIKTIEVLSEKS
ncbi:ATP-binding protein [Seleniivibrio woodruffii]|uniref:DNA polymerase-3 subunit delta n=1 Tax=Seleniivibrio woodruffii TaxID=1078050 RepID=A0A4R1KD41_9BACT|nr:DNA polymerase III subunit delta' [Seleniivibrio woodruffii]TCK62472.1 DNA polymerase-3 subunit delta' [Seleniivibrio woodruffii]TVZ37101.1 DNA polymerase-3 subunit delta' [Seleniivibrio woodruffii]